MNCGEKWSPLPFPYKFSHLRLGCFCQYCITEKEKSMVVNHEDRRSCNSERWDYDKCSMSGSRTRLSNRFCCVISVSSCLLQPCSKFQLHVVKLTQMKRNCQEIFRKTCFKTSSTSSCPTLYLNQVSCLHIEHLPVMALVQRDASQAKVSQITEFNQVVDAVILVPVQNSNFRRPLRDGSPK